MSCDLTKGRQRPCKDSVGGLKAVYFIDYGLGDVVMNTTSGTEDNIASIAASAAYRYDLKGNSNLEQTITSSTDTGGTFFEQVLTLVLPKLTAKDHKELKLISFARPHVIIKDNNDNYFMAGLEHGMDVTGGTISSGAGMGDLSGYSLTFTGQERAPANFCDITVETDTQLTFAGNGSGVNVTVVPGVVADVDVDDNQSGIPGGGN
tara:strand:+ start:389 stop:1006 length:618 start_codon:yes stop_codon:yes gene_type:complete